MNSLSTVDLSKMYEPENDNVQRPMDMTEKYIASLRNYKASLLKVLTTKKHLMNEDEKMEFLELIENLYCWINKLTPHLTVNEITTKGRKLMITYGRNVIL
jgi:hypothetical protein